MQGLILAAGVGRRIAPYNENATKSMINIAGKTLIERALLALAKNNIQKTTLVVGYKSDVFINFLIEKFADSKKSFYKNNNCFVANKSLNNMQINFIFNEDFATTNNIYSLSLAEEVLCSDDTILLESDLIFTPEVISNLINSKAKNVVAVSKFESWMDGTCVLLDNHDYITTILDKNNFDFLQTQDYYKTVNVYKFSKEFSKNYYLPFLKAYQTAFGKNEYYEQVLKVISLLSNNTLKAVKISSKNWYEIDNIADLQIAENRFANAENKLKITQQRYGGYWRFPQMLDFCYLVNPYFPPKQLVDEIILNTKTLISSYPSGAAELSLLAARIFKLSPNNIAVGNGASELINSLGKIINGNIAIIYPTFNEYERVFTNCNIIPFYAKNFEYDVNFIIENIKNNNVKLDYLLLINPDNPSGNFINKKDIFILLDFCVKQNIKLIFDESFIDFSEQNYTLLEQKILNNYKENLIVIKSISKSYGVAGLRLGILASADANLIANIIKQNSIWNINSFAENFLQIFEKYSSEYSKSCDLLKKQRSFLIKQLNSNFDETTQLKVFDKSQANYLLCKILNENNATLLAKNLLNKTNIFIKDLSSKKCFENQNSKYFRIAVRNKIDNQKLVYELKKYL